MISRLSQRVGMSASHFRRLFKEHTGRSPQAFITALRISKAKELLAEGMRVGEVAEHVGYDDAFYFMRVFKQLTGVSAGKFV